MEIGLNIGNSDCSSHALERKQCINYLGVVIDESLTWKYPIAFVCSRKLQPRDQKSLRHTRPPCWGIAKLSKWLPPRAISRGRSRRKHSIFGLFCGSGGASKVEVPGKNNCLWPRPVCVEKKWFLWKHRASAEGAISGYCELFGIANVVGYKNPNEGLQIDGRIQFLCVWMGE